jgi:hypothetical protein
VIPSRRNPYICHWTQFDPEFAANKRHKADKKDLADFILQFLIKFLTLTENWHDERAGFGEDFRFKCIIMNNTGTAIYRSDTAIKSSKTNFAVLF